MEDLATVVSYLTMLNLTMLNLSSEYNIHVTGQGTGPRTSEARRASARRVDHRRPKIRPGGTPAAVAVADFGKKRRVFYPCFHALETAKFSSFLKNLKI